MTLPEEKATILYVEDNPDNRLLVRRILLSEDYGLLEAQNATQALDLLKDARAGKHKDKALTPLLMTMNCIAAGLGWTG